MPSENQKIIGDVDDITSKTEEESGADRDI